ncbi:ProQ/FINO family protein [Citrobacter freundii]|uniref:ProQ/FINO family protein n=1 Tax=Citrobacter freundii TaxID=546 RepID=UPI001EF0B9B0|nr:ProQ/FINO family protein [Citrobacter freundii]
MSERPVLTLKRRPAAQTSVPESTGDMIPVVRRRKTMVVVAAPDPRKQKKQAQKDAEKAAEAERKAAAKEEWRRQWLLKNAHPPKNQKAPVRLMPVVEALRGQAEFWPRLFNPELPLRLMKTGIREEMEADIVARQLSVSVKQLRRCLRSLTRSEGYLNVTQAGSIRYGLDGLPVGVVTEEEYQLSRLRLQKILRRREYTGSEPA